MYSYHKQGGNIAVGVFMGVLGGILALFLGLGVRYMLHPPKPAPNIIQQEVNPGVYTGKESVGKSGDRGEPPAVFSRNTVDAQPILLGGDDVLEIEGTHYIQKNDVILRGSSILIIRDSFFELNNDFAFEFALEAHDNSRVVFENSMIGNPCTGELDWKFFDSAVLQADTVRQKDCGIRVSLNDNAKGNIINWDKFAGAVCANSTLNVQKSFDTEVQLCLSDGAVVDEVFPTEIETYRFPNDLEKNIGTLITIRDSSVYRWGIDVVPKSYITIEDTENVSIKISARLPWEKETVLLKDFAPLHHDDKAWDIVDARLRLIDTTVSSWEASARSGNTIIIRDSTFAGLYGSGNSQYIIENSTLDFLYAQGDVEMTVRKSEIASDIIATGNSAIRLINTSLGRNRIEQENGLIIQE